MIEGLAARWLLTAVFGAAGLTAALPRRGPAKSLQWADRVSAAYCGGMCAALIAMTWRSEPAAATWLQAAVFGCAALGFGLASVAGTGPVRRPRLPAIFHALMAGAMIWMLTAMPAAGLPPAGSLPGAMASMSQAATPASVGRRQCSARSVLRGRVHPVAGAGHRLRTSGERSARGRPGRDERRDGGDAVRDAVTISMGRGDRGRQHRPRSASPPRSSRYTSASGTMIRTASPPDRSCERTREDRPHPLTLSAGGTGPLATLDNEMTGVGRWVVTSDTGRDQFAVIPCGSLPDRRAYPGQPDLRRERGIAAPGAQQAIAPRGATARCGDRESPDNRTWRAGQLAQIASTNCPTDCSGRCRAKSASVIMPMG